MCDQPQCYTYKVRKARKEHQCCECGTNIEKGKTYHYISGIWDSKAYSYKTCNECRELQDICEQERSVYDDPLQFGGLEEHLENEYCESDDVPENVKMFFERCKNYRRKN